MLRVLLITVVVTLGSAASSWAATPPFVLVSDVDDTVRITDVSHPLSAFFNALFTTDAFGGMADLYGRLTEGQPRMTFISGSPKMLRSNIASFLEENRFPGARVFLRDWWKEKDTIAYKLNKLERVAAETNLPLVLVGDDTEHDPEIYSKFATAHPERVLAIYIRRVLDRDPVKSPVAQIRFHTAFDIAVAETAAGRLSEEDAIEVAEAVIDSDSEYLFPSFAVCPSDDALARSKGMVSFGLEEAARRVAARVAEICEERDLEILTARAAAARESVTLP